MDLGVHLGSLVVRVERWCGRGESRLLSYSSAAGGRGEEPKPPAPDDRAGKAPCREPRCTGVWGSAGGMLRSVEDVAGSGDCCASRWESDRNLGSLLWGRQQVDHGGCSGPNARCAGGGPSRSSTVAVNASRCRPSKRVHVAQEVHVNLGSAGYRGWGCPGPTSRDRDSGPGESGTAPSGQLGVARVRRAGRGSGGRV